MLNILITGSKGFIGKNLIQRLEATADLNILEFNRNDSAEQLEELLIQSDYIVHLAGEVRPSSSSEDFKASNVTLTSSIIDILEKHGLDTPILLASTIHAQLLKNEYGKTKRDSEILVENYADKHNVPCVVYRLPHVFGEGCKQNYNSVISTWIYNSIHNLEINVFDINISMHYVYVQDIIDEFLEILEFKQISEMYINPQFVYETTLGEVVDFINEFKQNIDNSEYLIYDNGFKSKLFKTYKDYYKKLGQ